MWKIVFWLSTEIITDIFECLGEIDMGWLWRWIARVKGFYWNCFYNF